MELYRQCGLSVPQAVAALRRSRYYAASLDSHSKEKALNTDDSVLDHNAGFREVLDTMLSKHASPTGYLMSLWTFFYTGPVFARIEKEFSLLRDEFNVLACLTDYGPITAKGVCEVTGRPKNSVSRAVERLVSRELIDRRPDPRDRRKSVLTARPRGRALYRKTLPLFQDREALMLRHLSDRERETLNRLLFRLIESRPDWNTQY